MLALTAGLTITIVDSVTNVFQEFLYSIALRIH